MSAELEMLRTDVATWKREAEKIRKDRDYWRWLSLCLTVYVAAATVERFL